MRALDTALKPLLPLLRGFSGPRLLGLDHTGDTAMAPAEPPGGRAISTAGRRPVLEDPQSEAESAQQAWRPIPDREAGNSHGTGVRLSPDPLRTTDRYRLVTPFKLKL